MVKWNVMNSSDRLGVVPLQHSSGVVVVVCALIEHNAVCWGSAGVFVPVWTPQHMQWLQCNVL